MGSSSSSTAIGPADAGRLVGGGVCGADGLLGRCLAYSLKLDSMSGDTKSEWLQRNMFIIAHTVATRVLERVAGT